MQDRRIALPPGTRMELLSSGSIYEITGPPMGLGGGGIIYPARKLILKNGGLQADGIYYALKECYPVSDGEDYCRSATGEIVGRDPESGSRLREAKKRYAKEKERNLDIHVTADRMLPILESADQIALTLPGQRTAWVSNTVSVMESLANKGRSLSDCLAERRRFSALETCRILQQLLFALREVHRAGYLHLDIQGGNVFLRGALEDRSDLLTLIDFGSARSMKYNGKTKKIQSRVIFTSKGFSAPEILLHNTGELQLGPEADIYSVGCMGLYLLTGQLPNQSQLLANRSGNYLKPNQMRLVNCPADLQDRLQKLLASALEKDPEKRCCSADEMLKKVNELLDKLQQALRQKESALSSVTYDAFLCYKHGPIDSPAAKALQQRLEHFHIIDQKGRKIRPFHKIFMDVGELSACADFGQQINDALKNSRWLIVICSEDTPLSPWVELEIDTFLKLHGEEARSRILTVLTSGEPETAMPSKLLEQKAGIAGPLAADARGENLRQVLKKLKGDALLRLAAAMLEKPFDSLKQRQKVYVLQRVAAVTAVFLLAAVGFAAYAVNRSRLIAQQAVRIREEYENALINESLLLAEQAERQLKNNNPLDAMVLALKALPSPEQDRPVVPEAEYVLGKSLGIYVTPGAAEDVVTAVGMINTDDSEFFLDDTGTCLFTWDRYENGVQIWDAGTLSPVRELLPGESIYYTSQKLLLPEQQSLILRVYNRIVSTNYLTADENWSFEKENILAVCTAKEDTRVVLLSEQEQEDTGEKTLYLDILAADTGRSLEQFSFRTDPNHDAEMCLVVSPDMKWAAVPAMDLSNDDFVGSKWHDLYLIDLETGSCRRILDTDTEIITLEFLEDRLALIRVSGYTLTTRHSAVDYQYTEPIAAKIETYDPETGSLIWSSEQRYYLRDDSIDALRAVPYETDTTAGTGLLATSSDLCVLLDWDSGQTVREYELQSAALDIRYRSNGFDTLNADGSYTVANYSMDTMLNIQYFDNSVSRVCRHEGKHYIQSNPVFSRDYSIRKYELGKSDESYRKLFEVYLADKGFYDCRSTSDGFRLVVAGEGQLCLMDSADGSVRTWDIPEEYGYSPYRIQGVCPDAQRVYWCEDTFDSSVFWITDHALWETDLLTGESRQLPVPEKPEKHMTVMDRVYAGDAFYFTAGIYYEGGSSVGLFRWDPDGGAPEELYRYALAPAEDPEDEEKKYYWEDYQHGSLQVDAQGKQACFATVINHQDGPEKLIRVDLSGGMASCILPGFAPEPDPADILQWEECCYQWSPDGTCAVFGYGSHLYLTDDRGTLISRIPAAGYTPVARFLPDGESLLVITDDQTLRQYRTSDGTLLTGIDLNDHMENLTVYGEDVRMVPVDENTVALFTGWNGFLLDTSRDAVRIRAVLNQGIGYDPRTDRFLVAEPESYNGQPAAVGNFRRYSLEELIGKARAILDQQG